MLKKFRLLFSGNTESESQAKKRIKQKQQELAERLKKNMAFQDEVLHDADDTLDLSGGSTRI